MSKDCVRETSVRENRGNGEGWKSCQTMVQTWPLVTDRRREGSDWQSKESSARPSDILKSKSAVRGVLCLSGMDLPVSLMNWPLATEKQGSGGSKCKSSFFTTKLELVGVLQGAFLWLLHWTSLNQLPCLSNGVVAKSHVSEMPRYLHCLLKITLLFNF